MLELVAHAHIPIMHLDISEEKTMPLPSLTTHPYYKDYCILLAEMSQWPPNKKYQYLYVNQVQAIRSLSFYPAQKFQEQTSFWLFVIPRRLYEYPQQHLLTLYQLIPILLQVIHPLVVLE